MDHKHYPAGYISGILAEVSLIAIVGISIGSHRASRMAMRYLLDKGYDVYGVNPVYEGTRLFDRKIYGKLSDIPYSIDMVSIFRNSAAAGAIVDEAILLGISVIWMQLGVINPAAAQRAESAGLRVVMDRCPKIEYGKLSGEWNWVGGNSGILSSRRPVLSRSGFQHLSLKK